MDVSDSNGLRNVQVLLFDVFGTTVDWHGSLIEELAALGNKYGVGGSLFRPDERFPNQSEHQMGTGVPSPKHGGAVTLTICWFFLPQWFYLFIVNQSRNCSRGNGLVERR